MAEVDGKWASVLKTPMGPQESVLTIVTDGAGGFTGDNSGAMGTVELRDGKVDGNTITWKMDVTTPMKLTLEGKATVEGDSMTGTVKLGMFGSAPMTATRQS